jgi:hypothetical protein
VKIALAVPLASDHPRRHLRKQKPRLSGAFEEEEEEEEAAEERERMMGFEPTTFCMASRRSSQLSYIRERGSV